MSAPLRIGLLTPSCTGFNALDSGIGQHFADLAAGLTAQGHTVWVVTPPPKPGIVRDAQLAAVNFFPFEIRMPAWLDRLSGLRWQLHSLAGLRHRIAAADRALAACVARESIGIVETTSSGLFAARYLRRRTRATVVTRVSTTGAQLVAHNAGASRWPERVEQRWEERLVRASDGLITHTINHRDELCRAWHLAPEAFTIIPHGIAVPADDQLEPASHRTTLGILFVGRFEHRKGIDVLLAAIPQVVAEHPQVHFTLIGQDARGECQARFRQQHPQLADKHVNFVGQVSAERLRAAYRECDIFVAPSRYESFGLIYVEAMAWGKPVVACASGGTVEVVADGETGWLVPPGRADELAARLLSLLRDGATRRQFGTNARLRVQRLFSRPTLAARSAEYYQAMLSEPRSRVQPDHR